MSKTPQVAEFYTPTLVPFYSAVDSQLAELIEGVPFKDGLKIGAKMVTF